MNTSPGLNYKAIRCRWFCWLLFELEYEDEATSWTYPVDNFESLSNYSMKPLFPIFGKSGREAKDLSSESIFVSNFKYKITNKVFYENKASIRRSLTMLGGGRAEGTEKETQRYHHKDILQSPYFLHCSCELQKSDEAMGEWGVFLVITSYILKVNAVICNAIQLSQQFSAKSWQT